MNTLVHICCAPCLLGPLKELQSEGFTGYFYNPNVQGLVEFRRRLKAVKLLSVQRRFELEADESYGLSDFLEQVDWRQVPPERCRACYRLRLDRTARVAREKGFEAFTTTLLVSRHQPHEIVREVGEEVGRQIGIEFRYHDWRHLADEGLTEASRLSLYRQGFCGCIFSERERYENTRLHCYKGDG
jgi:epoxyqueuosine reductase